MVLTNENVKFSDNVQFIKTKKYKLLVVMLTLLQNKLKTTNNIQYKCDFNTFFARLYFIFTVNELIINWFGKRMSNL